MEDTKESRAITAVKKIFLLFLLAVGLYFFFGQIFLAHERAEGDKHYKTFSDGWVWVKEDGSRDPIAIPGKCTAERNELMIVENVLPDDVEDHLYLCIRSSKQEMKIYIDGILRQEYSTEDTRLFGRVSAVALVFVALQEEDAGKEIRMEIQTDSSYSGVFHEIHYGEKWDIWSIFFKENGLELITGLLMFVLGVTSILISVAFRLSYKKNIEMEYLGWAVFLTSIWILANSVFRQVLFPSVSVISDMAFFMVMLIAVPFMLYMNCIQRERYWKPYFVAIIANLLDTVVCTSLHVLNLVDFSDTIKYMGMIAALSIGLIAFTMTRDVFTGKIKEYRLVAFGIFAVCLAALVQMVIYFKWTNQFSGSVMAVGLVFILIISSINTMQDVLGMEREKQQAVMSNEAKGKFLANMSHEIRTPINAVLGMDAMILRECTDENIQEYALNIQNAGQTLLALINDILDFSKIESGKMELIPVEYDFSSMINDVVNMIMMRAEDKGLQMHLAVDSSLPFKLYGDEVRIRQILTNLLTNAVKYTKEGSVSLKVSGKRVGEEVSLHFCVEDTGIGIKPEDIQKLFARFERIEEERNRSIEGTGLGMNITMQLLKLMDSQLQVKSEYGRGSSFSFEVRQKIISDDPIGNLEERIKKTASEYEYAASFAAPDARLLVVDDNGMNRKVFISLLEQTRVQIEEADSGATCLELVKEKHYDLIFLDHMMPEMDGVETLHRIREMRDFPCENTPVVALTANAIQGAREMYLREGFDDFLSKPVRPEKLEKMIQKLLPQELLAEEKDLPSPFGEAEQTGTEKLPEIEGVDWDTALLHLPGRELLMETVYDFYSTLEGEAAFLEQCLRQLENGGEALDDYRIKVHSMKSSAALIGIMQLSEQAKALEQAAAEQDKEFLLKETGHFLEEWRSYKEKLAVCIQQGAQKEITDLPHILELLQALKESMEILDVDLADEQMRELRQYQYPDTVSEKMGALSTAVVNLDSQKADELIDAIVELL